MMNSKIKKQASVMNVAPTSELVLYASKELYNTGLCASYIEKINLEEGKKFEHQTSSSFSDFVPSIIYRKLYVREAIKDCFARNRQAWQVCLLGAGMDPLSLHMLVHDSGNIKSIFEMDLAFMEEKALLYEELLEECTVPLNFITADISSTDMLLPKLIKRGYDPSVPTLIIMEGLVYYLQLECFIQLLSLFKTDDHRNLAILDYMLEQENISESESAEFSTTKKMVESKINGRFRLCSRKAMRQIIQDLDGTICDTCTLQEVERRVSGSNKVFQDRRTGIIDLTSFYI